MVRIHPADFEAARQFAERAHAMRLASLYVNAKADLSDFPPEFLRHADFSPPTGNSGTRSGGTGRASRAPACSPSSAP
jgi:hypothetical protein